MILQNSRIRRVSDDDGMHASKTDKRLNPRSLLSIPFVFKREKKFFWSITEDISLGGLYLQSFQPPESGEPLELRIPVPGEQDPIVLRGRVVHRRERRKAILPEEGAGGPSGAGVAFEHYTPAVARRLRKLLEGQGFASPVVGGSAAGEEMDAWEREGEHEPLEDPAEILAILEDLCSKICPVQVRRLGGQIIYTTFLRDALRAPGGSRLLVDPVPLRDVDRAFTGEVPFVFHFEAGDHVFRFVVLEVPQVLGDPWTIPVPFRMTRSTSRRTLRYSADLRHPLWVEFQDPWDPGRRRVKNVLDVSHGSLCFKSYPGEEIYRPGTSLPELNIHNFDHLCRSTRAEVRHVGLAGAPGGDFFQRIGLAFIEEPGTCAAPVPARKRGELEQIEGAEEIHRHLKKLDGNEVHLAMDPGAEGLPTEGLLRAVGRNGNLRISLEAADVGGQGETSRGELLPLSVQYMFHGACYFFRTDASWGNGYFELNVPGVIHRARRRRVLRVRSRDKAELRFRFRHPVRGEKCTFPVRDLSIRGLSFRTDFRRDLFWKGFRLRGCEILLDDGSHAAGTVEIRSLVDARASEGKAPGACGVEFLDLPPETEKRISAYLLQENNPNIAALTAEKIDRLWSLFEESRFLYPGKIAYIQKIRPQIDETWKKLLSGDPPFYKHIVFKEGEENLGTASAVQAYENCWLLQHLAATGHPVKLIPKYVTLGLAQFLMENRDIQYLTTYFRRENSFPRRMYGGFLESFPFEDHMRFTRHGFLSLDLDPDAAGGSWGAAFSRGTGEEILVEPASDSDREIVENHFRATLHPLLIRAWSLYAEDLPLPATRLSFDDCGLVRERACLVARDRGRLTAFALLENASPGINLSGLLSGFSLYSVGTAGPRLRAARRALLRAVLEQYRAWGARTAICLTTESDLGTYLEAGFRKEKEYVCVTWSRRAIKSYYDYVQERFGRFEARKKRSARP